MIEVQWFGTGTATTTGGGRSSDLRLISSLVVPVIVAAWTPSLPCADPS